MITLRNPSFVLLFTLAACTEVNDAATTGNSSGGETENGSDSTGAPMMTSAGPTTTTTEPTTTTTAGPTTDDPDPDDSGTSDTNEDSSDNSSDSSSDDSTTTGGPPSCDGMCMVAPEGWNGPILAYEVPSGEADPGCGGVFGTEVARHGADPNAPAAVCGCECGVPIGSSCTTPSLRYHLNSNGCDVNVGAYIALQPGCNNITDLDPATFRLGEPVFTGGICLPVPTTELPPAEFASDVVFCSAELDSIGCMPEASCVPNVESPICVWAEGEQECPADFPVSQTLYTAFEDTRACGACECGDAEGACEMNDVYLYPDSDQCVVAFEPVGSVEPGGCTEYDDDTQSIHFDPPVPVSACAPSLGAPTGEVVPTGAVTMCCAG